MITSILTLLFFLAGLFLGIKDTISYINAYGDILLQYYKMIISFYIISLNCFAFSIVGFIIGTFIRLFTPKFSLKNNKTDKIIRNVPWFLVVISFLTLSIGFFLVDQNSHINLQSGVKFIDPKSTKIFVIGLDGSTWRVIIPLVKKGKLPVLSKLLKESYWSILLCAERATSPLVWTSIATGKVAEKHGIFDHTIREPGAYESVPIKSYHRKVKAIWNILSENKKSVGLIDWYVTFPPEKVKGYIISRLTSDEKNKTYPEEIQKDIDDITKNINPQKTEDKIFNTKEELLNDVKKLLSVTSYMRKKIPTDFLAAYTHSTDAVQHYFWKYMEPEKYNYQIWAMNDDDIKKYGKIIEKHWIEIDRMIGDMTKDIDNNTTLIILSDHGAQAQFLPHVGLDPDKILNAIGILYFKNGTQEIDFSKTKAFSAGIEKLYQIKGICLNLRGRESNGIIKPGEEEDKTKYEIMNLLADLKILENGKNLFSKVIQGRDIKEKRWKDTKTDIFAYSNDEVLKDFHKTHIKISGRILPLIDILSIDDTSGEHSNEGIILIHGKNIKPKFNFPELNIKLARALKKAIKIVFNDKIPSSIKKCFVIFHLENFNPTTLDITPTILYSMGLPVGKDMDGKTINDAFNRGLIGKYPVNYINTYEVPSNVKSKKITSTADKEVLKKLKALGYIE